MKYRNGLKCEANTDFVLKVKTPEIYRTSLQQ